MEIRATSTRYMICCKLRQATGLVFLPKIPITGHGYVGTRGNGHSRIARKLGSWAKEMPAPGLATAPKFSTSNWPQFHKNSSLSINIRHKYICGQTGRYFHRCHSRRKYRDRSYIDVSTPIFLTFPPSLVYWSGTDVL